MQRINTVTPTTIGEGHVLVRADDYKMLLINAVTFTKFSSAMELMTNTFNMSSNNSNTNGHSQYNKPKRLNAPRGDGKFGDARGPGKRVWTPKNPAGNSARGDEDTVGLRQIQPPRPPPCPRREKNPLLPAIKTIKQNIKMNALSRGISEMHSQLAGANDALKDIGAVMREQEKEMEELRNNACDAGIDNDVDAIKAAFAGHSVFGRDKLEWKRDGYEMHQILHIRKTFGLLSVVSMLSVILFLYYNSYRLTNYTVASSFWGLISFLHYEKSFLVPCIIMALSFVVFVWSCTLKCKMLRERWVLLGFEASDPGRRSDNVSLSELKHASVIALVKYVWYDDDGKEHERDCKVDLELLSQVATPNNMRLTAKEDIVWEKLCYTAQNVQTVDIDRLHVLKGDFIHQDTCLLALDMWRSMVGLRSAHHSFPQPQ